MLTDLIGDAAVGEFVVLGHGGPAVVDVVVVVDVGQRVADRRPRHVADVETLKDIFSGQFFFLHMVDNFSRPQQNKLNFFCLDSDDSIVRQFLQQSNFTRRGVILLRLLFFPDQTLIDWGHFSSSALIVELGSLCL